MEIYTLKLGMFETLMVGAIAIYLGEFLRNKFTILKKYCLPAAVVGGTIVAIISLLLYNFNIVALDFDYKTVNKLFYCIFFASRSSCKSVFIKKR